MLITQNFSSNKHKSDTDAIRALTIGSTYLIIGSSIKKSRKSTLFEFVQVWNKQKSDSKLEMTSHLSNDNKIKRIVIIKVNR